MDLENGERGVHNLYREMVGKSGDEAVIGNEILARVVEMQKAKGRGK